VWMSETKVRLSLVILVLETETLLVVDKQT
jgi:hypothetical protein